jgi:hypothetical protein
MKRSYNTVCRRKYVKPTAGWQILYVGILRVVVPLLFLLVMGYMMCFAEGKGEMKMHGGSPLEIPQAHHIRSPMRRRRLNFPHATISILGDIKRATPDAIGRVE